MTKKDIVREICERANRERPVRTSLSHQAVKEIVQWTFEAIIDALVKEGRIELRKFGVFEVKQRKPRKARNPRTGERVDVGPKNVVVFQPGKEMEERVRLYGRPAERRRKKSAAAGIDAISSPASTGPNHAPGEAVVGTATK